jgi:ribosomal protein L35AE/L33A
MAVLRGSTYSQLAKQAKLEEEMAKSNFKDALKTARATWKTARDRAMENSGGDFEKLAAGRYKATIIDGELETSKSTERLQAKIVYQITEGDSKGMKKWEYMGLDNEDNLVRFGNFLQKLGFDLPESLDEDVFEEIFAEIKKAKFTLRVVVKEKGEYTNLYIQKVLGADEAEESDGEEETGEGDDEEADDVPEPKAAKKSKKPAVEEEDASDDEEEEEAPAPKAKGKKAAVVEEDEEEEDIPEKPAKKSKAAKFVIGSRVTFESEGEDLEGTVTEIDGEELTVDADDDNAYIVEASDAKLIEAKPAKSSKKAAVVEEDDEDDEEEVELKKGDQITWKDLKSKKELTGMVKSIDEKAGKVTVVTKDKKLVVIEASAITGIV